MPTSGGEGLEERKQSLNIARLIDREKYYKKKALNLEKQYIFASEQIAALEEQIEALKQENQHYIEQAEKTAEEREKIRAMYEELRQTYEEARKNHEQLVRDLNQEIAELKKNQRSDQEGDAEAFRKRIKSYERLLGEIQTEINEKDKAIAVYKRRLAVLEKRLNWSGAGGVAAKPDLNQPAESKKPHYHAVGVVDYALILGPNRALIRGDLIIENVGEKPLDTPYVCFRFTPGDVASLKGKIVSLAETGGEEADAEHWQWAFVDNDWAQEAKERGEIWLCPTAAITLSPGERITLNDWQAPLEQKYSERITIEIFLYFQSADYRTKAENKILINF